jgi:hypothetical protein
MIRRDAVKWEPAAQCVIPAPAHVRSQGITDDRLGEDDHDGPVSRLSSLVSLVTLALVVARAVNILP